MDLPLVPTRFILPLSNGLLPLVPTRFILLTIKWTLPLITRFILPYQWTLTTSAN